MNASVLKSSDIALMIQASIKCIATLIPADMDISISRRSGEQGAYMDIHWPTGAMSSHTIPMYAPTTAAVMARAISTLLDEAEG